MVPPVLTRMLRWTRLSFKRKLLLFSLVLSIFPVLTVGLLSSVMASRSMQAEVDQNHRYMLNQMQVQLSQFMNSLNMASIYISTNLAVERSVQYGPGIENLNEQLEMNETIRRIRSTSPVKYHVSILYKRFNNFIYSNEYDPSSASQLKLFNILDKLKPNSNQSFYVPANSFDDQPNMLLFRPVPISTNYTEGVLVLQVTMDNILTFIGSVEHGQSTRLLVADANGRVVISSKQAEIGRQLDSVVPAARLDERHEDQAQSMEADGESYKLHVQIAPETDWTYVAMTPLSDLTRQSVRIKLATWIVAGLLALIWMLVAAIGSRRMYFPIQRLSDKVIPWAKDKPKRDGLAVLDDYLVHLADANRKLNDRLNEQFPYLKQGIFQQLLRGELSEQELQALAERIQMPLRGSHVFVCVAEADDIAGFHRTYQAKDRALIHYALLKMMEETFHRFPECTGFTSNTGQAVLLIGTEEAGPETRTALRECADELRANVRQYFRFPVSVAIGPPQLGYAAVGAGYAEALALLSHRLVWGDDLTITADRADERLLRTSRQMVERQKQIVFHVMHGNLEESGELLAQLVAELPKARLKPVTARGLFSYMLGELDYMLQQAGCDLQQVAGEDVHERLSRLRSLPELEHWLREELFPAVKAQLHQEAVSKQARTVRQVVQFVQDRMQDEISLQLAADHFQLSLSYLSRIFKEEYGRTFSEFVLELKMLKAKEWLEHTDKPIKEIAVQLGYSSVQNFNRTFKQWHEVPPGEFRKWKRDGA